MTRISFAFAVILAVSWGGILRADNPPSKFFQIEEAVNDEPSFMLAVDVARLDPETQQLTSERVFREGDHLRVTVKAEEDCYLYLLYYSGDHAVALFPNKHDQNNKVPAGQEVTLPQKNTYNIVCRPPFGKEILHVVATRNPVNLFSDQKEKDMRLEAATEINEQELDQMVEKLQAQNNQVWAEHRIKLTTMARGGKPPKQRRMAVCIGISQYQSDTIQQLQVSHRDAEKMADSLKNDCGVEEVVLLTNQNATKAGIENAIFKELVAKTNPGDTAFIFFSGHGARVADTNGDEEDGYDELLVPYDGVLGKTETMILDDTFARWIQELDGRKVVIILDNCYSGGSSKSAKGISKAPPASNQAVDFFDGEIKRSKDLGQQNTVVLAACQANQLAWEMPDAAKGSVLTHYLLESFRDPAADTDGDGKLSVGESFRYAEKPIQAYVEATFNAEQIPVLIENSMELIFFK